MNLSRKIFLLLSLLSISLSNAHGICGETNVSLPVQDISKIKTIEDNSQINIGALLVSIFRDHISAVDGDRCPSLPSCSSYSIEAFKKHGFFVGWVMTVDRLFHEIDEDAVSPLVNYAGRAKIFDPVENNDFWWVCSDDNQD